MLIFIIGGLVLLGLWIYGLNSQSNEATTKFNNTLAQKGGIQSATLVNKRQDSKHKWMILCDFRVVFNDGTTGTITVGEGSDQYNNIIKYCG